MLADTLYGFDVFDEPDLVQVIVELPGVRKEDLSVDLHNTTLDIVARAGTRQYHRHIELEIPVKGEPVISGKNRVSRDPAGKGLGSCRWFFR